MLHQKLHLSKCVRNCDPCRFVDPRLADINHVVGARGLSDALAEVGHAAGKSFVLCAQDPALLYHFAGRSKDWEAMLETFGLDAERRSGGSRKGILPLSAQLAKPRNACLPRGFRLCRQQERGASEHVHKQKLQLAGAPWKTVFLVDQLCKSASRQR